MTSNLTPTTSLARLRSALSSRRELVALGVAILVAELFAVFAYLVRPDVVVFDVSVVVIPLVWLNASLLALAVARPPSASRRHRAVAATVAGGYLLALAYLGGILFLQANHGHGHSHGQTGFQVATSWALPPGWGPRVQVEMGDLAASLVPYKVAGYATLAYLVYVALLDAADSLVGGAVGLLSCVSCTWPVAASVAGGLLGGGSAVATAAAGRPYWTSTLVFVAATGLLVWRLPTRLGSEDS